MKFNIFDATDGLWYFDIIAGNGKTIAYSKGYSDKRGSERAAQSVKDNAGDAEIVDE